MRSAPLRTHTYTFSSFPHTDRSRYIIQEDPHVTTLRSTEKKEVTSGVRSAPLREQNRQTGYKMKNGRMPYAPTKTYIDDCSIHCNDKSRYKKTPTSLRYGCPAGDLSLRSSGDTECAGGSSPAPTARLQNTADNSNPQRNQHRPYRMIKEDCHALPFLNS